MALQIVGKGKGGNASSVKPKININPKTLRMTFNKAAERLLDGKLKATTEHFVLMVDKEDYPNIFWVRPVKLPEEGARKLARNKVASCGVQSLITGNYVAFDRTKGSKSAELVWDEQVKAARVDLNA